MKIGFLLGPAGTGKTWRCIQEARQTLQSAALGKDLIFLTPKQATFQIERDVLSGENLECFSRLHILSFERLARYVLEKLGQPEPALLNDEGRTMVLRALLAEHHSELQIFKNFSKRSGFPQELSNQLREFEQYRIDRPRLNQLMEQSSEHLRRKFHDLVFISEKYAEWLNHKGLKDGDCLLALAADRLREHLQKRGEAPFRIARLWMDGFAQMTTAERLLLSALIGCCENATLAFCLETDLATKWPAPWGTIQKTCSAIRSDCLQLYPQAEITLESLGRDGPSRFELTPDFAHLEKNWGAPAPYADEPNCISVRACATQEDEVRQCAREIIKLVQAGSRYSDIAVILRSLDTYHDLIHRIFERYEIPVFLDKRQNVSHHPLAELTRGALRSITFGWRRADIISTIKSGFFPLTGEELDLFENAILANGWEGKDWAKEFTFRQEKAKPEAIYERFREVVEKPLAALQRQMESAPGGHNLAENIRDFWKTLQVEKALNDRQQFEESQVHNTVWLQMNQWLDNVERAFAGICMPLRDWLTVLESGLASLSVGLIPPQLDQVLAGSVDRSRNPDLKTVFVLGLNERVFPQPPKDHRLITESERRELWDFGVALSPLEADQMVQEQFYGYIACTRARERLILSYAKNDASGKVLNPSRFISWLQQLFPKLKVEHPTPAHGAADCLHRNELVRHLFNTLDFSLPSEFKDSLSALEHLGSPRKPQRISAETVKRSYGDEIKLSITSLEHFAHCSFKFFVDRALRAKERSVFELESREEGSFKHEVMARYHEAMVVRGGWRSVNQEEAQTVIGEICDEVAKTFNGGLLMYNQENQFRAGAYKANLQEFIAVLRAWLDSNSFEPAWAELAFGGEDAVLDYWRIDLGNERRLAIKGRVDRVDVAELDGRKYFVVFDYKTGGKTPSKSKIFNGLDQQITAYIAALASAKLPGSDVPLEPGGFFYVPLSPQAGKPGSREEILHNQETARRKAYQHHGLFDVGVLGGLDPAGAREQFHYKLNKDQTPNSRPYRLLSSQDFNDLLRDTMERIKNIGNQVFDGEIRAHPIKSGQLACERCEYLAICRYDAEADGFRKPVKA